MLNARFVEDYINAVRAHGYQSPIVPVTSLQTSLGAVTLENFLGYSVIPVTLDGELAVDGQDVRFVAMPHVYRRKKQGTGEVLDRRPDLALRARQAGLTSAGFAPKRGTTDGQWEQAIATARDEADEILARLVAVYGLPNGGSVEATGNPDVDPRAVEHSHESHGVSSTTRDPESPKPASDSLSEDEFFYYMLARVRSAFEDTDIARYQRRIGVEWWYSVCALPLRRERDLLLGLKWGADSRGHLAQARPPTSAEIREVFGFRFIARTRPFLERHVAPLETFNYLNVCPFRAHKLEMLTPRDWKIAIEGFFIETIDYLRPPRTVIVGTSDVRVLMSQGLVDCEQVQIVADGKVQTGYRGVILGRTKKHPFGAVPQPTYAMTNAARERLWSAVFG